MGANNNQSEIMDDLKNLFEGKASIVDVAKKNPAATLGVVFGAFFFLAYMFSDSSLLKTALGVGTASSFAKAFFGDAISDKAKKLLETTVKQFEKNVQEPEPSNG